MPKVLLGTGTRVTIKISQTSLWMSCAQEHTRLDASVKELEAQTVKVGQLGSQSDQNQREEIQRE